MAVTNTVATQSLPFAGYEPVTGLPQGIWSGSGRVTGDGSGGEAVIHLNFSFAGQEFRSSYYSLEQLHITDDNSVDIEYMVDFLNLGSPFAIDEAAAPRFLVRVQALTNITDSVSPVQDLLLRPIFLGKQFGASVNVELRARVTNVSGVVSTVTALGYFWQPGAVNAIGGLKRPANSLWT